ncbi:uncharacterized protein BBOV_IV003440 [Babesia bovis T2Bo]|uniref:PNPLA domain-containing protein n=1 Tax=Babesia bovis TaxID=5865 RepID=A7AVW4_BABBO|nr:uncharacterized protein BBOV_IV003440 [Babesia bovis T2Bo]EDO05940.1 hypothetical protein BBOV_IV003440 [Babesia bovis T2Bo]|eukprot:XP_001609508.1 hypothetical protein [Babesia bovis T2Bo]
MALHSSQTFAFSDNYFGINAKYFKGIDKKLQTFTQLGFFNEALCDSPSSASASSACASEVFTAPRIYLDDVDVKRPLCRDAKYLDPKLLREFFESQGVDIGDFDCDVMFRNHKFREMMEHMRHLVSLTVAYEDPDPSAFVLKKPGKNQADIELAKDKTATYKAYDSDFEIKYISPNLVKSTPTAAAPSFYHLFTAVADGVERVLSTNVDYNEEDFEYLQQACNQIELFTGGSVKGLDVVRDILRDYSLLNMIHLTESGSKANDLKSVLDTVGAVNRDFKLRGKVKSDLGVSFSPGGFLLSTYVGFVDYMVDLNVINMTTPLAGGSAGSMTVSYASMHGTDRAYMMHVIESLCHNMRNTKVFCNLDLNVLHYMKYVMAPDSYKGFNERIGKVRINYAARVNGKFKPRYVVEVDSDDDLVDAIRSSCNVPNYYTVGPIKFKGDRNYDGIFATDGYFAGATKVIGAHRTVRFMSMSIGYGRAVKKNLQNDVANPFLQTKDKYFIHYLRLKSLQRMLMLRRYKYARVDNLAEWEKELDLSIKVCHAVSKGASTTKEAGNIIDEWTRLISRKPRKHPSNTKQDEDSMFKSHKTCKLARLFKLVLASESELGVGQESKYHAGAFKGSLDGVPIMKVFGAPTYNWGCGKIDFLATPRSLIDWLFYEKSLLTRSLTEGTNSCVDEEIELLLDLSHHLGPPPSLTYYYTEFPSLLLSSLVKVKNTVPAFYPATLHDIRHFFDVGRTIAFRWLLGDYIAFENWIHLRVRQLIETPVSGVITEDCKGKCCPSSDDYINPIHKMQFERLDETMKLMDQGKIDELKTSFKQRSKSKGTAKMLFQRQNHLVRRAILFDVVDSHFTHILGHTHFWIQ